MIISSVLLSQAEKIHITRISPWLKPWKKQTYINQLQVTNIHELLSNVAPEIAEICKAEVRFNKLDLNKMYSQNALHDPTNQ